MANSPYLTDQAVLGASPEVVGLERQRRLADLLTSQAFQSPQGQMISGQYVKPAITQQIQPLLGALLGSSMNKSLDEKQVQLAAALRGKQAQDIQTYAELQKTDPSAALRFAISSDNPTLRTLAQDELKGMKLSEGDVFTRPSLSGGVTEFKGGAKYHPIQTIDLGTKGVMVIDPNTGTRTMMEKGREAHAGQVLETENGPMLIDTRTGQARPIMSGGQPVAGGKPLTESQGNATAFGMRMKESNAILNDLEKKGVTNTGIARSVVSGVAGMTPFMGEKLQQGVSSAMNALPSALGGPSGEQQQVDAARKNFVTAVLRKESGAAISPSEFYTESQKYFPQIGDTDAVLRQKQHARETAIKAMEIQAGSAGTKKIEQFGNQAFQASQAPMFATNGQVRIMSTDGGKTWQAAGGK